MYSDHILSFIQPSESDLYTKYLIQTVTLPALPKSAHLGGLLMLNLNQIKWQNKCVHIPVICLCFVALLQCVLCSNMQSVSGAHSPLSGCCFGSAPPPSLRSPRAPCCLRRRLHHHHHHRALSVRPGLRWAGAAGACWTAWLWPAGSAGAGRRSVASPAPAAPALRSRSGSRSCCDAAGRARSSGGASPSPRCVAV